MPLKERTIVDERERMALMALSGVSVSAVAKIFLVSRPTVRLWRDRFEADGRKALEDRGHATKNCPHRTSAEIEALFIAERKKWGWGSKKLRHRLAEEYPDLELPHRSTIDGIFARNKLVAPQRRRSTRAQTPFVRRYAAAAPSELTTIDYKGQYRMGNGQYCYPLTIVDDVSRYILASEALSSTSFDLAWPVIERIFRQHGLPLAHQSDNGPPFGSPSGRFSKLSVRLMMLDVQPVFNRPAHPEDNPRHERMHREMKAWVIKNRGRNLAEQQSSLDEFCRIYNHERPHEGIQMNRPARVYESSSRKYPTRIRKPEYPLHFEKRKVSDYGYLRWNAERIFVGEAFAGQFLAFEQTEDEFWTVHFYRFAVGKLDERRNKFL